MRKKTRRRKDGFTLIEVLLVLVILVILASLVGFYVRGAQQRALVDAAKSQIGSFKQCVEGFQLDVRNYPSSAGGLQSLITPPSDLRNPDRWKGPYLDSKKVPLDPWDMPYQYQLVDANNYEIWSLGPDGADGTEDDIRLSDF
jgi:general secretion pathway protein G